MSASAATRPAAAAAVAPHIAAWNPSVSAASGVPPASASLVTEAATVDRTAMPIAPPICHDVLIRPDASPACASPTAGERGDRESARTTKPIPNRDQQEAREEVGGVWAADAELGEVQQVPGRRAATVPATSTGLTPMRVTSRGARRSPTPIGRPGHGEVR